MTPENFQHAIGFGAAIKFNNTCSGVACAGCNGYFKPEIGYCVTLRDSFDFLCLECAVKYAYSLHVACFVANSIEDKPINHDT